MGWVSTVALRRARRDALRRNGLTSRNRPPDDRPEVIAKGAVPRGTVDDRTAGRLGGCTGCRGRLRDFHHRDARRPAHPAGGRWAHRQRGQRSDVHGGRPAQGRHSQPLQHRRIRSFQQAQRMAMRSPTASRKTTLDSTLVNRSTQLTPSLPILIQLGLLSMICRGQSLNEMPKEVVGASCNTRYCR